jgi:epoxyqueuosine reductase
LPEILNFTTKDWEVMTEENFKKIFKDSPLRRAKFKGIQRNLQFIRSESPSGF